MRRSLMLVLIASISVGAGPQKKPTPLPPLNAKVVEFARQNLGKSVGDGLCLTLATEALKSAGAQSSNFRERNGDFIWGELIGDFKDVLPGDILQFRDAVFHGKRPIGRGRSVTWHAEYHHHTAVVATVKQDGKLITIYQQNVAAAGADPKEKVLVQEAELRMDSLQKGGWVKAYRPVEGNPSNPRNPESH